MSRAPTFLDELQERLDEQRRTNFMNINVLLEDYLEIYQKSDLFNPATATYRTFKVEPDKMRMWTALKNGLRIHKFQLITVGPGEMITKEQGAVDASEDVIDEIDIPANRYDLLCLERLVQGLQNICRKLALVAIGTHELDTLMGPFTYDVKAPKDIKATPTSASTKVLTEDVANAYRYNRIPKTLPATMHLARQYPLNKLTEQLREQIAQAGFTENLAFTLPSRNDIAVKLNQNI
ncbi:hypothetical protein pipiens_001482 [Culex pipiens pipiens]|uniref:Phenylalanine--tRNA ligase beta subunit B1 domain-containing protein n=1 Tax=Culex pipiens pipiens TaxID=38569 RepID=A0ABD1CPJ0_CULPP